MGNLANGLFWQDNGDSSWCSKKWALDKLFMMPYEAGDELFIQLDLHATGIQQEAYVCDVHCCLPDGTRVIPNLLAKYGPAYWKADRNSTTLNLFSIKIPGDFGGCETITLPPTNCQCFYILTDAQHSSVFQVTVGGVDYNVTGGYSVVPGFSNAAPNGGNWRIDVDCSIDDGSIYFSKLDGAGHPVGFALQLQKDCTDTTCDCYYLFTDSQAHNTDSVIINGTTYTGAPTFLIDGGVAGFHPGVYDGTNWKVMADCAVVDGKTVVFSGSSGIYSTALHKENCHSVTTTLTLECFMFEFEIGIDGQCGVTSFYTEPYQCVHCEPTLKIGSYYGTATDTLGLWNFAHSQDADVNMSPGGLGILGNAMRIPAILRNLPSKFAVTKNEKCFTFKSEVVRRFELQGTKAYPPYFAAFVESVLTGKKFRINGREYQVRGDTAFEEISINGISAYTLKAQLEDCTNSVYFDCI